MAAAHKNLVLAAYRRKVAQKNGARLAAEANEAARRESMRNHPSNYRAQESPPALPGAS